MLSSCQPHRVKVKFRKQNAFCFVPKSRKSNHPSMFLNCTVKTLLQTIIHRSVYIFEKTELHASKSNETNFNTPSCPSSRLLLLLLKVHWRPSVFREQGSEAFLNSFLVDSTRCSRTKPNLLSNRLLLSKESSRGPIQARPFAYSTSLSLPTLFSQSIFVPRSSVPSKEILIW